MNLYKVSQNVNNNYDTYSDFVVACETEEEARHTNPDPGYYKWHDNEWYFQYSDGTERGEGRKEYSWCDPKEVKIELIGKAAEGVEGVVCASFHAG